MNRSRRSFLLTLLAIYRLAYLVAIERGPFDLAQRLRTAVYQRYGAASWQFAGVTCPLCISFWFAFLVRVAPAWLIEILGLAGGVLVLHRWLEDRHAQS